MCANVNGAVALTQSTSPAAAAVHESIQAHVTMTTINNTVVFIVAFKACVCVWECVQDVRCGVYGGEARRTLRYAGSIVNDILMAARLSVLIQLFQLLTLVVELLKLKKRKNT